MAIKNKRYNRIETTHDHFYLNEYGTKGVGGNTIYGYIKCKLAHTENASVVVPDQIYFNWDGHLRWIQPFNFMPCTLFKGDDSIVCDVFFDISCGYAVRVRFHNNDFVRNFDDGSQLFKCELLVPDDVGEHAIGLAIIGEESSIKIQLFHHTTPEVVDLIAESGKLLGSRWNIQGNKEIAHSDHAYFTPLHELKVNNDLEKVAMSAEARITLMRDGFSPPDILFPGWEEAYKEDFLVMEVYRETIANRTATLDFWVPSEFIAPHHLIKHTAPNEPTYYEIPAPFIHRVQIEKGGILEFIGSDIPSSQAVLFHNQIIIGDGGTLDGLLAPFDEENTTHKFEIQTADPGKTILDFWFEHANEDLYGVGNCHVVQLDP